MRYALVCHIRTEAAPGLHGVCECCQAPVVAKCGDLLAWHWAHESTLDCDTWSEGETEWHRRWKSLAPPSAREVVFGRHRADVYQHGWVLEFQHSYLSPAEIAEREAHYGHRLAWVFDGVLAADRGDRNSQQGIQLTPQFGRPGVRWVWLHGKQSLRACTRRVFIDLGGEGIEGQLLDVDRISDHRTLMGTGFLMSHAKFAKAFLRQAAA